MQRRSDGGGEEGTFGDGTVINWPGMAGGTLRKEKRRNGGRRKQNKNGGKTGANSSGLGPLLTDSVSRKTENCFLLSLVSFLVFRFLPG